MVDVALLGTFAKDRIVHRGVAEIASGGGVYYASVALRRLGFSAAVITRLHPDDFGRLDELRAEGVAVYASPAPQTTGIENIYPTEEMDRRICRPLAFAGPFAPAEIPPIDARVTIVTPLMAGEVGAEIIARLASQGPLGLDVQGFVRVPQGDKLVTTTWPEMGDILTNVTYLKLDDAEAEVLVGETDLRRAVGAMAEFGPREVVLTHGHGLVVWAAGAIHEARFLPSIVRGRTGRGDTCFSTYVAARLEMPPAQACRFAAAVTSLKIECPGPFRGTRADVEKLMAAVQEEI
ncbi:MAG TPA: PfkB family carbohydrate kinase [bacterium]